MKEKNDSVQKVAESTKICIVATGGTIEKSYDPGGGKLLNLKSKIKGEVLTRLRYHHIEFEVVELLSKDSLDFTDDDRKTILDKILEINKVPCPIIILHGTDTIDLTVNFINKSLANIETHYPICFTGAMIPFDVRNTDAWQNIIESIMSCQLLEKGIYLIFHGKVFKASSFKKNKNLLRFEDRDISE